MRLITIFALLFALAEVSAEALFEPLRDDPSTVDGGLSRGVAFGDADNDGDPDLLVANTINYPEFLYRNDAGTFAQVMQTGPSLPGGFSEGVNWVDFDNDGDLDVFVARSRTDRPSALYRNEGNWAFVEHNAGDLSANSTGSSMACWADVDNDGWLDVFVVNRGGQDDQLFRNVDGLSFRHITAGPAASSGGDGRSCTFADFDNDSDPDLYVGNFIDSSTDPETKQRNFLFINKGNFEFEEKTEGHVVENRALTYGSSAVDADNDGDLDLLVTNIGIGDENYLYLNNGQADFSLHEAGLATLHDMPSKGHTWGDFDLDGDMDLAIANGTEGTEHLSNHLYTNDGAGRFVGRRDEPFVTDKQVSAGIAWADIDADGDLDLYVANWGDGDEDNALYRNRSTGQWLKLTLVGTESNRMAIGAKVTATARDHAGSLRQVRWLHAQTGYASQNEPVIHFGLNGASELTELTIHWPSGQHDRYSDIAANRHLLITEGHSAVKYIPAASNVNGQTAEDK